MNRSRAKGAAMKWTSRILIACMAAAVIAGGGCKAQRVIKVRLSSTNINVLYYSRGRVVFEPVGETEFKASGGGTWADGYVTYAISEEGNFIIHMDGAWMQAEVMRNRDGDFPGAYVIEIPLVGLNDEGVFEVWAEYAYNDVEDGTGERVVAEGRLYPPLELPMDSGDNVIGIILECTDPQNEACTASPPETDGVEIPEVPDRSDTVDATSDPDAASEPDSTVTPDVPDATEDPAGGDPEDATTDAPAD